jgi:hypothetical protein
VAAVPSQLGSVIGQILPTACNLPPNACSGTCGYVLSVVSYRNSALQDSVRLLM